MFKSFKILSHIFYQIYTLEITSSLLLGLCDLEINFFSSLGSVHGKTTYEWHTDDIRVHKSDIRITYEYIRVTYEYIQVAYGWHTSK